MQACCHRKKTILVVDDEQVIRTLCVGALKEYRTFQASSVQEALDIYSAEPVDLVLTDVIMPGGSGIELLKQVKAIDPGAVVVVMTSFGDKNVILNALREDADDFINKPLQILQLRTAIQRSLDKKALKEELATIKRIDGLKGSFLSMISHKLRTPITSLSLGLEAFQHKMESEHTATQECMGQIDLMQEDIRFLTRLVTNLLRFNQIIVNSDNHPMVCDLSEIVRSAAEAAIKTASRPDVDVVMNLANIPAQCYDRDRLGFAMQQIIDNAFKFSPECAAITVTLEQDVCRAVITVSDKGCGIPADEMPKIFERFYQVDPDLTGQIPGFGLGLFCAREIVRQHGGKIEIQSEPGQGTVAIVYLPLAER